MAEQAGRIELADKAKRGASEEAIQAHYDVGNEFYRLWLDDSMTYSCAIWESDEDTLEDAQKRKLNYHIKRARAHAAETVLEIGCGWGACLNRLVSHFDVKHATGLTLSSAQANWISDLNLENADVRIENWADHSPECQYDAIISIAAMPHFVKPELTSFERIQVYREFFERCYEWLKPGGMLSIETQVYGCGEFVPHSPLSGVFPESDMPRFHELTSGFDGVFDIESVVNHRRHYPRTLRNWLNNLEENRNEASSYTDSNVVNKFARFLEAGIKGHSIGVFDLLRINLSKSW